MRARRSLRAFVTFLAAAALYCGSNSGVSVVNLLVIAAGGIVALAWWSLLLIGVSRRSGRLAQAWIEPAVSMSLLLVIYSGAPFYVRFLASKPFLDHYVRSAHTGEAVGHARVVGLFIARETEVLPDGVVRIITTNCMFDQCGLVFSSSSPPRTGGDQYVHLIGSWWRWWRSW
jgi:hypothetical protein